MVSARDVPPDKLINLVKEDLKKKIKMPDWAKFVKTSADRQRPPVQEDWWWIRAASILRKVYMDGPVGVSRLRTWYGGKKDRGVRGGKKYKASGKIIRTILQQLEELGFVKIEKGKGRVITPEGQRYLDSMAKKVRGVGGAAK